MLASSGIAAALLEGGLFNAFVVVSTFCLEITTKHVKQRSTSLQHRQKQRNGEDSTG